MKSLVQVVWLKHQADNPLDENAIQLVSPEGILGYLKKTPSQHLGPLLRNGVLGSHATVSGLGISACAPVDLSLEASFLKSWRPG